MTDTILQGNHLTIESPVTNQDGATVSLAGLLSAEYRISRSARSATALVTKTLGSGITQPSSSVLDIALTNADTQALKGSYHHELKVVDSLGNHSTLFSNALTITNTLID